MAIDPAQITAALQAVLGHDAGKRSEAETWLKNLESESLPHYLGLLATELANEEKPAESRRLAGITLKNALDAKDGARQEELSARWRALDGGLKGQLKATLMPALSSKTENVRSTASRVIAKIAVIELPAGEWVEVISVLLQSIQSTDAGLRAATLQTMGYICEELPADTLKQEQVNQILTAVVQGMRKEEPDNTVRLTAVEALNNAVDFASTNFENDNERNYVMQQVCEATQCPDARVREASLQCLVTIAISFYEKLPAYIEAIYKITSSAIERDTEDVAKQALEFWCTICEEEVDIAENYSEDESVVNNHFMKKALPYILPILLNTLEKQEEGQEVDDNAWTLAKAGGICLGLAANAVGDDIIPGVMQYVQQNFGNENWHKREAATLAFGSILDGPSKVKLMEIAPHLVAPILGQLKDPNGHVKDTSAWTMSRVLQFCHGTFVAGTGMMPVITEQNLAPLLQALFETLKDVPNVAEKICACLHYVVAGFVGDERSTSGGNTSPVSPYFQNIVQALLTTADRVDGEPDQIGRLRLSAYESLNEVVRHSSLDTMPIVHKMIPHIAKKLQDTLEMTTHSAEDRQKQTDLQGLLCGVLMVMIQECSATSADKQHVLQYADYMMQLFLKVFESQSTTVHEDAMLAIGTLANAVGSNFLKYMDGFNQYIVAGLGMIAEHTVCQITVGVVGDVCRALDDKVLPYCDALLTQLLVNLRNNDLNKEVKPPIIACFGDIALAIGIQFERYLDYVMPMLDSAMALSRQAAVSSDEDMIDFNNTLRGAIFDAYSGILQGVKRTPVREKMNPYAAGIIIFIRELHQDENKDDVVCGRAVATIGDMIDTLDDKICIPLIRNNQDLLAFLRDCDQSGDEDLQEAVRWTKSLMQKNRMLD